jgi:esterase/lipase superfamily enzyme
VKAYERWWSGRVERDIALARWGHWGVPVLLFPTAGGDAEEVERNGLVGACWPMVEAGRVKLYSTDSVGGQAMVARVGTQGFRMSLMNRFHDAVRSEIVPAIRMDTPGYTGPILVAGSSIGAFNSLAMVCRYPDTFGAAVCMSGTFDLQRFYDYQFSDDLYFASPLHFLPGLDGPHLDQIRSRFVVLATGSGAFEDVEESWRMAALLGSKGIPNRVDDWGPRWDHDWPTWRHMLPQYLRELT